MISPFSSFRILPPAGSGVSRVTPTLFMAQVLAEKVCMSTWARKTGRSLIHSSIIAAVGISGTAHWNWMTCTPVIHSLSGWESANAFTRSMACSKLVQSMRFTQKSGSVVIEPCAKCVWESMMPGITSLSP